MSVDVLLQMFMETHNVLVHVYYGVLRSKVRVCLSPSNDLALLKLDKSPIMTDSVGVACLPEAGETLAPGSACYISGWGNLYSKTLHMSARLRDAVDVTRGSVLSPRAHAGQAAAGPAARGGTRRVQPERLVGLLRQDHHDLRRGRRHIWV